MADVYDTDYVLLYRHKKSYREGDVLHHLIDQKTQHPHTRMHLKVFRLNMTYTGLIMFAQNFLLTKARY